MFLAVDSQGIAVTHDFVFSIIQLLKTTLIPAFGISFWTLYCGCFYLCIITGLIKKIIGIGGGDVSGGGSALRSMGSSSANIAHNAKIKASKMKG